jgi:hypothetical protein
LEKWQVSYQFIFEVKSGTPAIFVSSIHFCFFLFY